MKKLFSRGLFSKKNVAGKLSLSAKHVSTTLLLLLLCLLMPQSAKAELVTIATYDFTSNGTSDTEVTYGTTNSTYSDCTNFTKIGSVADPTRFASQNNNWILKSGGGVRQKGLLNLNNGVRKFLIDNLKKGDIVTFELEHRDNTNAQTLNSVVSNNATQEGNTVKMTASGLLAVSVTGYINIKKITIQHDDAGTYSYDPAKEAFDLTKVAGGLASNNLAPADYQLNGGTAQYLTNLNGMAANNRITVTGTDNWTFDGGLKNNTGTEVLNLSIANLLKGDRVRITYENGNGHYGNNHLSFGSDAIYGSSLLNSSAFKDNNNDGELETDEDEHMITRDEAVDGGVFYTMTEDGHLDLIVYPGVKITKIEIYSDHEARMLDSFDAAKGYTAYFSQTGQLLDKEHNVGGLEIHVGNENETQHAEVVLSDQGPVSFVYDQEHFKMARHATFGSWNVASELPVTGTFYKFIPEVSGKMSIRFKAYSVHYNYLTNGNGRSDGNEEASNLQCPYYLMVVPGENNNFNNNSAFSEVTSTTKGNGALVAFNNITVEAGKVYYLYGWWESGNNSCGIAQLIDVTFMPENLVYPLAKWVVSGTTEDTELANVSTTTTDNDLHIKKTSGNISSCEPYVEGGVLKIRNIQFKSGENPGGTILIKVGDPNDDATPVFAYTIAYDASWQPSDWTDNKRSKGHTWDFSTNPLRGLKWTDTTGEADDVDFGKGAGPGLLYDEMHETINGIPHTDWTFKYVTEKGDTKRDPMYVNKYIMEGDNADMMWDTEGLIFNTPANLSCINNEFDGVVNHNSGGTATDPDRFVGIRPGGSFTIPKLKVGDRVEIYVGSADSQTCFFKITGALDAIGQTIEPTDEYNAGGSLWSTMGGKCQYRGAYQFISTGGDMTFYMTKGELAKLYSIQIYSGLKSASVDCSRTSWNETLNGAVYTPNYQFNNEWRTETPANGYIQLHYRGKGERLRTPTVLYKSGNINTDADHLFYAEIGDNNAPYIFFKSEKEQYGMFRMRIDDMESGGNYVADYALQNITVGYLEKKNYPYTWDFTDLTDYVATDNYINAERTKLAAYAPKTVNGNYDIEFMNNSVGENVAAVEQWKWYDADTEKGIPAGWGLQVRNEPYSGGLMWDSGQLYGGNGAFDESFGLSITPPAINENSNGGLRITDEGLSLTGGNWKIMIPLVGGEKVASVYVRATPIGSSNVVAGVGAANKAFTYAEEATDGSGDMIYAVKGTGEDMNLFFNNHIIKKIAISQDPKTVNKLGYATESRNVVIDPELMGYMTGTGLKAYTVTSVVYGDKAGDVPSITLTEIGSDYVMGKATTGDHKAYIIYNTDDTKAVNILDNGFHLFVPDMHDDPDATNNKKDLLNVSGNYLVSNLLSSSIPQTSGDYTNYLMNYKYTGADGKQHEGPEAFYRAGVGASLGNNKAYLQLLTEKVKPENYHGVNPAKFAIIFVNEEEGTETTSLDGVKSTETLSGDNSIYTLSGVKVSQPQKGGIYVKNGKKVVIK